jgi:hypothetical protein
MKNYIIRIISAISSLTSGDLDKRRRLYEAQFRQFKEMMPADCPFTAVADNPQLSDNVAFYSPFGYYILQDNWAFSHVLRVKPVELVDVASSGYFVAFCTNVTSVISIDLRHFTSSLPNHKVRIGNVMALPFDDNTVAAISSLSVIEHIGLGRYGDALDPYGMEKAARELGRVLAPEGMLLVAFPIGKTNIISFNAHRICTPEEALKLFSGLDLIDEKYVIADKFYDRTNYDKLNRPYAYGCYRFTKRGIL